MIHHFYVLKPGDRVNAPSALPAGYHWVLWQPSLGSVAPSGVTGKAFVAWWLFHHLRVFANREYRLLVIYCQGRLVHRSGIYPRYLRFPFMSAADLQIGDTWTEPHHRGRGLAGFAIGEIVRRMSHPGRTFWYLVEPDNTASIKVIERVGFRLAGLGDRGARFGLRVLGAFHLSVSSAVTDDLSPPATHTSIAGSERRA